MIPKKKSQFQLAEKYRQIWPKPVNASWNKSTNKISGLNINSDKEILKNRFYQLEFPEGDVKININLSGSNTSPNLDFNIDESYSITYSGDDITIAAKTVYGAIHALASLRQLVRTDDNSQITIPSSINIQDKPVFPHRGILIDTGRVYLPKHSIKRTISGMAFVKLNVLHWHLTDAQNFPYVPPSHPELAKGSTGKTYSQDDIKEIVKYANERGVRVIIEIDTPAHTYSWGVGHPELMTCNDSKSQNHGSCPEPPCGVLDITNKDKLPKIQSLVQAVWSDALQTTGDSFAHIGGDELKKGCTKNPADLQNDFVSYVNNLVAFMKKQGKTSIMWEDILAPYLGTKNSPLDKDVVIETWLGDHVPEIIDLGHKVIATGTFWYLDVGRNTFFLDNPSWAVFAAWQYMYNRDILNGVPKDKIGNVLGGEACVWGETIDKTNLESLTWPRASILSEVLWSNPAFNTNLQGVKTRLQDNKNQRTDVWKRFQYHREDLLKLGLYASPVAPPFCVDNELCTDYANDPSRNKVVWPRAMSSGQRDLALSVPGLLSYCTANDPCIGVAQQTTEMSNKACPKDHAMINGECIKSYPDFTNGTCPSNTVPVAAMDDNWAQANVCMGASKNAGSSSPGGFIPGVGLQQNASVGQFPATLCYDTNGWTLYDNL